MQTVTGVDKVVEGHGHVNTWAGLLRYLAYTQKVVEVAAPGDRREPRLRRRPTTATSPPTRRWPPTPAKQIKPGLEYGGTPKSRSLNNIYVAMRELRGERPRADHGRPAASRPGAADLRPRRSGGPAASAGRRARAAAAGRLTP